MVLQRKLWPSTARVNGQLDPRMQLANTTPLQSTTSGLHPVSIHQFIDLKRMKVWVDLGGWLHTEIKCCLRESLRVHIGRVLLPRFRHNIPQCAAWHREGSCGTAQRNATHHKSTHPVWTHLYSLARSTCESILRRINHLIVKHSSAFKQQPICGCQAQFTGEALNTWVDMTVG